MPERMPMVIEKAIFSGVRPLAGTRRNGIRILSFIESTIFKTMDWHYKLVMIIGRLGF